MLSYRGLFAGAIRGQRRDLLTRAGRRDTYTSATTSVLEGQIAAVLRLSEEAVTNRLTRPFARAGLRSRTEIASAMLTGNALTATGR